MSGKIVSGFRLLKQLFEDLVDVESIFGRTLDVAVFPVEDHGRFEALVRNGVVVRKVGLVSDDDDRNFRIFGLVDHVTQPRYLLPRLRRVEREDDDESVGRGQRDRPHGGELVDVRARDVLNVEPDRSTLNFELAPVHVVHRFGVDGRKLVVQKLSNDRRFARSGCTQDQDSVVALCVGQIGSFSAASGAAGAVR